MRGWGLLLARRRTWIQEKMGLAWDAPDGIIGRRLGRRLESK